MDKRKFDFWNRISAAFVLVVSAVTYLLTIEPTASFWDCGEFIASSYKLEVGHPPGNPVFQLVARFFTMFTDNMHAAVAVNVMSALCSALTIFFLYLTIVFLAKRAVKPDADGKYSVPRAIAVYGSGIVGALAYCFSDTFWFSAVEGEVYAMSSLFTAMVFWAMTKWYEQAGTPYANRWIVLISFLMGLSIGVHLLNLLTIPALVFMFYYKKREDGHYSLWEYVKIFAISAVILAVILFGIIPYLPKMAAYTDLFFVNVLGMPFNTGAAFFMIALLAACFWGLFHTMKRKAVVANTLLLCFTVIVIGFSIFTVVIIRSAAKTPTNEYQPDNPFTLIRYLGREQYGRGRAQVLKGVCTLVTIGCVALLCLGTFDRHADQAAAAASDQWQPWSEEAVNSAIARGQPVVVDFTAAWCVTCQFNKATALRTDASTAEMNRLNYARFEADWTNRDGDITAMLNKFGRTGVPLYLLYKTDGTATILPELLSESTFIEALRANAGEKPETAQPSGK